MTWAGWARFQSANARSASRFSSALTASSKCLAVSTR